MRDEKVEGALLNATMDTIDRMPVSEEDKGRARFYFITRLREYLGKNFVSKEIKRAYYADTTKKIQEALQEEYDKKQE